MQMHTEPTLQREDFTEAHKDFLAWVNTLLIDRDKQIRFEQLFTVPLGTNDLCSNIYLEFPRALQAHNKYVKNLFTTEEAEQDFKQYCENLGFDDFFKSEGMEALKKYINSFIVVDLPSMQIGARPEPYFYMLHLDQVIDAAVKKDGTCEYIVFCQDLRMGDKEAEINKRAAVFDDNTLRMYIYKGQGWVLENEIPHTLGMCPAFKFYPERVSKKNPLNSLSPITSTLGDLDELLFKQVSIKYYETYGMYPIYWAYKQTCSYIEAETGAECTGEGQLKWYEIDGISTVPHFKPCPKCAQRKLFGPGSIIMVDPPEVKEQADLRDPVGYVGVDVPALEFSSKKLSELEARIIYNTTGNTPNSAQGKEAINEIQVKSLFESRTNVLTEIKKNFEKAIYWTYNLLARWRYDKQYLGTTVDLGNEFFLRSVEELNKDYSDTKAAGRPLYELAAKREFLYLTAYHNNPEEMQRLNVLQNLEPYQDFSVSEMRTMGVPQADPVGYIIKLNFYNFVKRFERENLPITLFGESLSFAKKIEVINNTLKQYADEQLQTGNRQTNPFIDGDKALHGQQGAQKN